MRSRIHSIASAGIFLCASAAYAANQAVPDISFEFVSRGHSYPAGRYMGSRISSRLDAPTRRHSARSIAATVSGQ
jgi:hypothetical protein